MSNRDAIAVIEFSLEFDHFFNIDLYVGGFYQLRCQLKTAKKLPSKIDVSIPRSAAPQLFPASVVNGKAVGTAFEILYKEEDISLNDMIEYKAFVPLKMSKLPNVIQFHLSLELWYIDKEEMLRKGSSDVYMSFECVSKRHLILNFPLFRGLHYHRPIVFDYFHLCATTLTVHGSLVALEKTNPAANVAFSKQQVQQTPTAADRTHKSYSTSVLAPGSASATPVLTPEVTPPFASSATSTPRLTSASSLASSPDLSRRFVTGSANLTTFEEAVFGTSAKTSSSNAQRLQNAYQFHRSVCRLLLTAYEALELKLTQLLQCLPSRYQIRIQSVDCAKKFEILQQNIQRLEDESELLSAIDGNVALLSGELTMLWRQFLELFRGREEIRHQLAKEHHTARVRRLAEGFFSGSECASTSTLIDFSNVGRMEKTCERLEEQLRKSTYFQCLPPLGVYCEDLDGSPELLPVVFEQRYQSTVAPCTPHELDQTKASILKHSNSAKISTPAISDEVESSTKEILKGTLSLDLPHVNRPAKQQQKIETREGVDQAAALRAASFGPEKVELGQQPQDQATAWKATRMGSCRKPLLSRSSSFRLWRRQRRLHTFPMAYSELGRVGTGSFPGTSSTEIGPLAHSSKLSRSTPDLKSSAKPLELDQVSVKVSATDEVFQTTDKGPRTGNAVIGFGCLNCCHSVDVSAVAEPEHTQETISSVISDNGHQEGTKEPDKRAIGGGRRTSSLSGDEDERALGVSYGLDALSIENERNLIVSPGQMPASSDSTPRLTSGIEQELLEFVASKEHYKQRMRDVSYDGHLCSDFAAFPSTIPYFLRWNSADYTRGGDVHLIVCVHGLDGTCADLRMVRAYIELCLPDKRIDFLMSKRNQMDTFNDFETMTRNLVDELLLYLSHCSTHPTRISFIGHSLGNVIIRSALADPRLEPWLERLYTFLSLNGPHCGILYNNNSVVNMGIWFVQRWKKSMSLQQMALKDNADLRQTFMYQLSTKPCFQYFKYVLLVGSHDDFYVPMHSALVQFCRPAMKDNTPLGQVYTEIIHNIMLPLLNGGRTTVIRYSVFHAQQASSTTSHLLGRAAHIAVLDSDLFIEKLLTVSALRYFR